MSKRHQYWAVIVQVGGVVGGEPLEARALGLWARRPPEEALCELLAKEDDVYGVIVIVGNAVDGWATEGQWADVLRAWRHGIKPDAFCCELNTALKEIALASAYHLNCGGCEGFSAYGKRRGFHLDCPEWFEERQAAGQKSVIDAIRRALDANPSSMGG